MPKLFGKRKVAVDYFLPDGTFVKTFDSIEIAAKELGINQSTISNQLGKYKPKKPKNYLFKKSTIPPAH